MEYIDICDSEGNLIGEKKIKEEVYKHGLWHKSAHVWVVNSAKEVLIQKRSPFVYNYPNKWDISAAGHVSAGEEPIVAALREAEEEIGLKLNPEDLIQIGKVKQISSTEGYINNEINYIYIVKKDLDIENIEKQHEEVAEVKFIPYKELQILIENNDPSFVQHPEEHRLLFDYISQ